jgi:hypothetical protein
MGRELRIQLRILVKLSEFDIKLSIYSLSIRGPNQCVHHFLLLIRQGLFMLAER